jgi:hypothetical protein
LLRSARASDSICGFLVGQAFRLARRGIESAKRLGRHRYVIERTLEWVSRVRRLARRYERKSTHFTAFARLACTVICYRRAVKLALLIHNTPK